MTQDPKNDALFIIGQIRKSQQGEGGVTAKKMALPSVLVGQLHTPHYKNNTASPTPKTYGGEGRVKIKYLIKRGGHLLFSGLGGAPCIFFVILAKHFSLPLSPSSHNNGPVTFSRLVTFDRNPRVRNPF